jgi:hypothetical protein
MFTLHFLDFILLHQPTTDRFIAVVHGEEAKTIKGNALTGVSHLPYAGLSVFGSGFLNKFSASVVPATLLKGLNIIGNFHYHSYILSKVKHHFQRSYGIDSISSSFCYT